MSKEKQIDEMAWDMCDIPKHPSITSCEKCNCHGKCQPMYYATRAYNTDYRKQSEGEWVERIEPLTWCEDDVDVYYECSCCGTQSHGQSPYCPNCGAKMKGDKWK